MFLKWQILKHRFAVRYRSNIRGKCVAEERKPTIESCTSTTQMDCTENSRQRPKDQVLHRSTQICSVHLALPARSYLKQLLTKKTNQSIQLCIYI